MTGTRVGQEIAGKYRLVRLLGAGGMGEVYEAQHTVIGRRFAIKFLRQASSGSRDTLARFRREAQAAGSLESENIAAVTDFGSAEDGDPYIVMEYLVGEDLSRLLAREGPMPVPRVVDVVVQACRGLHAAHGAGIVHRDLKPENLFVARRGDGSDLIKVLDFGIAKLRKVDGDATATRTGTTMGTPFYMPPEQARGDKDIDHRADVYALGVILYEALSGAKPHPGDSYNAILYHILSKPVTPLESLRPGLPTGLAEVVHRALAFEASDRFASVAELTDALVPFAGRAVTPIRGSMSPDGSVSSSTPTLDTPPSVVGAYSPTERAVTPAPHTPIPSVPMKKSAWGLTAVLVLVVVGGASAVLASRSDDDQGPVAAPSQPSSALVAPISSVSLAAPTQALSPPEPPEPPAAASTPAPLASTSPTVRRSQVRSAALRAGAESAPSPAASRPSSVRSFVGDRR